MTELSESFYITLVATASALIGLCVRYALRSKCDRVECLCLKIHRAVDLEEQALPPGQPPSPTPEYQNIYRQNTLNTIENIQL